MKLDCANLVSQGVEPQIEATGARLASVSRTFPSSVPDQRPSILVLDQQALGRDCLVRSIVAASNRMNVASASSLSSWREAGSQTDPDLILLILPSGPLKCSIIEAETLQVVEQMPDCPLLLVGQSRQLASVMTALESGAMGYVPTSASIELVCGVINLLLAGGRYVPVKPLLEVSDAVRDAIRDRNEPGSIFTPREEEVAEELRRGKANKIIAYDLDLCESTVKVHVRNIMRKLEVTNRTQAAFHLNQLGD